MFPGPASSKADSVFTIGTQTYIYQIHIYICNYFLYIYIYICMHTCTCSQPYRWKHQKTTLTQTQVIPAASSYSTLADQDESPLVENTSVIWIPLVRVSPDTHNHGAIARTVPRGAPFLWVDYWGYYLPPTNVSLNSSVFVEMNLLAHNFTL